MSSKSMQPEGSPPPLKGIRQPEGSPPKHLPSEVSSSTTSENPSTPKSKKMPSEPSPYTLIISSKNKLAKKLAPTKTLGHRIKKNVPKTRGKITNSDIPSHKTFSKLFLYINKDTGDTYKYKETRNIGLIFENTDTKAELSFPTEKAAHLNMIQKAWFGGKKTRKSKKSKK